MKKLLLFLGVFMISLSSFAQLTISQALTPTTALKVGDTITVRYNLTKGTVIKNPRYIWYRYQFNNKALTYVSTTFNQGTSAQTFYTGWSNYKFTPNATVGENELSAQYGLTPWAYAVNADWNAGQLTVQRADQSINGLIATQKYILKDQNIILLGFNAATFQADEQLKKWIFPLDLLCIPEHIDTLVKKLIHILNLKNLKSESFNEYAEILPPHTDITLNNKLLVRIFETSACHSYHELQNKMKIASIPTLLNFFFAMIYADKEFIEHTSKDRIICSTQELMDLANDAGKRRYKLLTPITCTGEQKDLMDMKKEKSDLYEKLSTNKNSKAFLKYFFSYTPKHSFHGGRVIELSRMFPKKPGLDYSRLKLTPEGEYSITKSHDSLKIIEAMKKLCKVLKNKTIADLSGNVGGDTIRFGINFKEVDSYELNPINFEALKNNVEIYDLKNVHLHLGDATKLFKKKVDFVYIDPPWGGPDYKDKEKLVLKFGDNNVDKYLKSILEQEWRPKYIFLKLPSNYDFDTFTELPNIHTTIHKFQIRGFYLLGIKTLN